MALYTNQTSKFNKGSEPIYKVYQFSRLYWKSVRQQNLPVTIKYPEMVAQFYPYFQLEKLSDCE
jgi:hypothetical protein